MPGQGAAQGAAHAGQGAAPPIEAGHAGAMLAESWVACLPP